VKRASMLGPAVTLACYGVLFYWAMIPTYRREQHGAALKGVRRRWDDALAVWTTLAQIRNLPER
jgi:hypothetical protein